MDEFGKGTIPSDGIALFAALLQYLAEQEKHPRTIAITHFFEIYQQELLRPDLPIKWCTMDVFEGDTVTFLYKVCSGKAHCSLGLQCAARAGLSEAIIERARELVELYAARLPPSSIRYAKVDPAVEQACNEIVGKLLANDPSSLETLRAMARSLEGLR